MNKRKLNPLTYNNKFKRRRLLPSKSNQPTYDTTTAPNDKSESLIFGSNTPHLSHQSVLIDKDIQFQQLDIDYYFGSIPTSLSDFNNNIKQTIIRLYGVLNNSNAILCHVFGFVPYFYCHTFDGFKVGVDDIYIKDKLNELLNLHKESYQYLNVKEFITNVSVVYRQTIWEYNFDKLDQFLKVFNYFLYAQ